VNDGGDGFAVAGGSVGREEQLGRNEISAPSGPSAVEPALELRTHRVLALAGPFRRLSVRQLRDRGSIRGFDLH
jgi:hypothetical protein